METKQPSKEREALAALVKRLDEVHADPQYQAVWALNQIRGGEYKGPSYANELEVARKILRDE